MFRTDARSAIAMVSLNVEPAVALLTYDVIVTDKVDRDTWQLFVVNTIMQLVEISNISTYGVKALFYINIDDAPRSSMFETFDEGSNHGPYTFSMTYAGDYTVTVTATDWNGVVSVQLKKVGGLEKARRESIRNRFKLRITVPIFCVQK